MNQPADPSAIPPWYRQFWPWFLIALPAVAIFASAMLIWKSTEYPVDLVNDDYYKDGLAINRTLDKDHFARQLGLSAAVHVDPDSGEITATVHSDKPMPPAALELELVHPMIPAKDHSVMLAAMGHGRFVGRTSTAGHRWYLRLRGAVDGRQWQLKGQIDLSRSDDARLEPVRG